MVARQQQVLGVPGIGVAGDFADMNPRFTVLAGPGGLVAGAAGVYVGRFGWLSQQGIDPDNAAQIVNNFYVPAAGAGASQAQAPDGFVPRMGQEALITLYLADASMQIPQGMPLWMASEGGFLVLNSGSSLAQVGMKAYASLSTGLASFAATGSPSSATGTSSTIAAGTWSAIGSITGNVMTVGAVTGTYGVPIGATVTGSGVPSGTVVVAQLTGTLGGAGTYAVSIPEQAVAAGTSLSGTFGVLTVGGTVTGAFVNGGVVSAGSGVTAGTVITAGVAQNANFTGAGGAGTYAVNLTQSAGGGGESMSFTTNVETKWYARSAGGAGELVKMSTITQ